MGRWISTAVLVVGIGEDAADGVGELEEGDVGGGGVEGGRRGIEGDGGGVEGAHGGVLGEGDGCQKAEEDGEEGHCCGGVFVGCGEWRGWVRGESFVGEVRLEKYGDLGRGRRACVTGTGRSR